MKPFESGKPVEVVLEIRTTSSDLNRAELTLRHESGASETVAVVLDATRVVSNGTSSFHWHEFLSDLASAPQAMSDDRAIAFGRDLFDVLIGSSALIKAWRAFWPDQFEALLTVDLGQLTERFARLPFELLHHEGAFLFARPDRVIRRTLLDTAPRAFEPQRSPRVLVAWSCPVGAPRFDAQPHIAKLRTVLGPDVDVVEQASLEAIRERLSAASKERRPYDYLHILAHGYAFEETGALCLAGPGGGEEPATAQQLSNELRGHGLKLVFLCSCRSAEAPRPTFSGLAQHLLASHGADLPCVVATQGNLPIEGSADLAAHFYKLLLELVDPAVALARARTLAFATGGAAWVIPVVLMRPHATFVGTRTTAIARSSIPAQRSTYLPREALEQRVLSALHERRLVSIVGLPGIGKTEIGLCAARAALGRTADRVEYFALGAGASLSQLRAMIASRFGVARAPEFDSELAAIVAPDDRRILLVLDNAEDLMLDDKSQEEFGGALDAWLGAAPTLRVLLTTRWVVGGTREPEHEVHVSPMDRAQVEELLARELTARGVLNRGCVGGTDWTALLDAIDGHPRSLWLIASQIEARPDSLRSAVTRLEANKARAVVDAGMLGRSEVLARVSSRDRARLRSLIASMDLSFDALEHRHPDAVEAFLGLSYFPAALPDAAAQSIAGGVESTALYQLYRYHLIEWSDGHAFFPIPIRWYAEHKRLERRFDVDPFVDRAWPALRDVCLAANAVVVSDTTRAVDIALSAEPNLRKLIEHDSAVGRIDRPSATLLAASAANALIVGGRLGLLQELTRLGLESARLRRDRLGEAGCLWRLGDLKTRIDDLNGAHHDYESALTIYREVGNRLGEANCLESLGRLEARGDNFDRANQHYGQALRLYRSIRDRLGEANCLQSMGDLKTRGDDLDGARNDYDAALPIYSETSNRLGQANCLKGRGNLKTRVDDLKGAREDYDGALSIYRHVRDRLGEANCLTRLGDLKTRVDDLDDARMDYDAALPIYREIGDRIGQACCLKSIGDLDRRSSALDAARRAYDAALVIFREIQCRSGEAHCIQSRGDLRVRTKDLAGATSDFDAALLIFREIGDRLGEANCLQGRGNVKRHIGRLDPAREDYDAALLSYRASRDPLGAANCLQWIGLLELTRGAGRQAFRQFIECRSAFQEIGHLLGEQTSLGYMARAAAKLGARDQAVLLAELSLAIGREIEDTLGQSLNLELQQHTWTETGNRTAAAACMFVRLQALRTMGDKRGAAQLAHTLDQLRAAVPEKAWSAIASDPESVRLAAIEEARIRFRQAGRALFDPPPELAD